MIKEYSDELQLLNDNKDYLDTNKYLAVFFRWDGPILKNVNKKNYALKCISEGKCLLALKVEPYDLLLFGEPACVPELFSFISDNQYEVNNYLCGCDVGEAVLNYLYDAYGIRYEEALPMDFMEAREISEASSPDVIHAQPSDIDEICECLEHFVIDCRLDDKVDREKQMTTIDQFRLIKVDGCIVSFAKMTPSTDESIKIGYVYTRDEYRGKGYARKVVNTLKNEIIESGMIATLNVDRTNPISNHIYSGIGFKRVFSQSEYRKVR